MALGNLFQSARNILSSGVANLGKGLGLPEMNISERIQGWGNPNAIQNVNPGLTSSQSLAKLQSEADARRMASGQVQGAATTNNIGGAQGQEGSVDLSPYRNEVASRIQQLSGLYNQLFGDIDTNVAAKSADLNQQYQTQQNQLSNDYESTATQLPASYAARGLMNSSYLENAQNDASQTFNNALNTLNQGRTQNQAQLGQFATTQKAQLGAGRDQLGQIDLSQYTDPNSLMNLRNQIDQQLSGLTQTRAGLQTNPQYVAALNQIAPAQQQGSAQLQNQLKTLSQSSAPSTAKQQIASGLIKSAGQNPNDPFWQTFWSSLSSTTGV